MKTRTLMVAAMTAASLMGCSAGAQMVRHDARGGEFVAWGPTVPAAQDARAQMLNHCGGRYAITGEALSTDGDTRRVTYACGKPLATLHGGSVTASLQLDTLDALGTQGAP